MTLIGGPPCGAYYSRMAKLSPKHRMPPCSPSTTPEERLARRTKVDPISGCHIWQGATTPTGYPRVGVRRRVMGAHRLAWSLKHGPIPKGADICHRCDERRCINPEHLFLDTHAGNLADLKRKTRARRKLAFDDYQASSDVAMIRIIYRGIQMKGELSVEPFDPEAVLYQINADNIAAQSPRRPPAAASQSPRPARPCTSGRRASGGTATRRSCRPRGRSRPGSDDACRRRTG